MTERQTLSNRLIAVLGIAVLLNYVDRGNLATAAPLLQEELSLSGTQMGLLFSSFFWTYAPAQLLAGWLAWGIVIQQVTPVPWPEVRTPAPAGAV